MIHQFKTIGLSIFFIFIFILFSYQILDPNTTTKNYMAVVFLWPCVRLILAALCLISITDFFSPLFKETNVDRSEKLHQKNFPRSVFEILR